MKTRKKKKSTNRLEALPLDMPEETAVKPNGSVHSESLEPENGTPTKPFYNPDDVATVSYIQDLGNPGEYPYTRGIYPNMYRTKLWTMRQSAGSGTARETNQHFKNLLTQGQTGLSCNFDLPTLLGYDSDHPRSFGEVGKAGMAVDSLQDMEEMFNGIRLDQVSTALNTSGTAAVLYSMYLAAAEKQGIKARDLRGTVQNDIFKELMLQDACLFSAESSLRLFTDLLKFACEKTPEFHAVAVSGYPLRQAGATAVQEVAFALAMAFAYVDEGIRAGLELDQFAPGFSFFFSAGTDLFEEVAKFRAARRIWARWMREKYRAKDPRAWQLKFHAETLGSFGKQQMDQGSVRAAFGSLAAVLGGAQSLHASAGDDFQALHLQQILAYETHMPQTADPLGGSYFMESLTNRLEEEVEIYFKRIDEMGGVLRGIQSGFFQKEIRNGAVSRQKAVENQEKLAGTRKAHAAQEKGALPAPKTDSSSDREQIEKLKSLKRTRSKKEAETALKELRRAAEGKRNLIPAIHECVRAYVTLGEIVYALKEVFGEYQPPSVF